MLTKKLIFTLGLFFFVLSVVGLYVFKVDQLPVKVSHTEIQALMDSKFYVKDTSAETGVTYEVLNPTVELLDDAKVSFSLDLNLKANPEVEWGKVKFVAEVVYFDKKHRLYLNIPDQAELIVLGKSSNNADFNLWNKDTKTLVSDVTVSINKVLAKYIIYALKGPELRVQAEYYSLKSIVKQGNDLDIVLNVHQGINIFILYLVMALSVFTFAGGYFFVGGVAGFKDPDDVGFHDPRKYAKRRRPGDKPS